MSGAIPPADAIVNMFSTFSRGICSAPTADSCERPRRRRKKRDERRNDGGCDRDLVRDIQTEVTQCIRGTPKHAGRWRRKELRKKRDECQTRNIAPADAILNVFSTFILRLRRVIAAASCTFADVDARSAMRGGMPPAQYREPALGVRRENVHHVFRIPSRSRVRKSQARAQSAGCRPPQPPPPLNSTSLRLLLRPVCHEKNCILYICILFF
jgi:hypothetical protein